jgi:Rho termination factor, N-terminal domain
MPGRDHGPSIKDPEQYEALRDRGASKEKAARISNESAREGRSNVGRRGGRNEDYDERTRDELRARARELGIEGRSKMTKRQLIDALRNH